MVDQNEICILIAASPLATRSALKLLMNEQSGLKVVSEAQDSHELLKKIESTCPDVLLLDWEMLGRATPVLINAISTMNNELVMIVLSPEKDLEQAALDAGADAFVNTGDSPRELLNTINELISANIVNE